MGIDWAIFIVFYFLIDFNIVNYEKMFSFVFFVIWVQFFQSVE